MFDGNIVPDDFQYSGADMKKMAIQFEEFANELMLTQQHWKSIIVYAAGQSADFVGKFENFFSERGALHGRRAVEFQAA